MHVLSVLVSIVLAIDFAFATIRVVRAARRRRIADASGKTATEPWGIYIFRLIRGVAAPVGVLLLLVVGFWAIVHFGPLRPIHEWFN